MGNRAIQKNQLHFQNFRFLYFLQVNGVTPCKTMLYYHRFQKVRKIKVLKESA
jgi:hypothetical protein